MKKKLLKYSICMMTALALAAAGSMASAGLNETRIVQAATGITITEDSDGYVLAYGSGADETIAKDGYYSIPKTEGSGITLNKGIYYFDASGHLVTSKTSKTNGIISTAVQEISASGSATKRSYVLNCSPVKKEDSVISSGISLFTGKNGSKVYQNGVVMTSGYALSGSTMYKVTNGTYSSKTKYTGVMKSSYVNIDKSSLAKANGYYYKSGKLATAVVDFQYYKAGKPSTYTGWKKMNSKGMYNGAAIYYFKKGKALKGWQILKSYSGGNTKYKYVFDPKTGKLITNLFAWRRRYINKKLYFKTNLTTHNTTIYIWDSETGKYDIPAITAVCSTSRTKNGTKPVKKTFLQKTSAKRWFIYTKSNPWHYYQWGVLIKNSASWYHSTMYKTKKANSLVNPTSFAGYNNLGTNQTTACIRHQAGMAKLIYDIAVYNSMPKASLAKQKQRLWVDIYRSSDKGPFGKITLKDSTGKLSSGTKKDPTDPNYSNVLFK